MKVLGIETSCDETAVALLEAEGDTRGASYRILGNALFSQAALHAEYGGVYPNLAKREHQKNLPLLLHKVVEEAAGATEKVLADARQNSERERLAALEGPEGASEMNSAADIIAVTRGPGLEPALWQGITFAEELGKQWDVPVIGVDHMEGHIVSALLKLKPPADSQQPTAAREVFMLSAVSFPLLALLISGGHTELVLMRTWHEYELIGRTRDDAVGEAFDKVARMLGLPYPGGPKVAELARVSRTQGGNPTTFPRPMLNDATCDFSFSGLKTAVLYHLRDTPATTEADKARVAEAFEDAVRDVLVLKTRKALVKTRAATLVVGGGVSANTEIQGGLRKMVKANFPEISICFPDRSLTGDNAIMIAVAGHLRASLGRLAEGPLTAEGAQSLA